MSKKDELKKDEVTGRGAQGAKEVEPGVFEDPDTGMTRPQHYPAAVVIDDSDVTGVKTPKVTPEEFNNKMNPADAKTTDSEYIVRASSLEEAQKLQDESRSDLPKEAQDPEASSR